VPVRPQLAKADVRALTRGSGNDPKRPPTDRSQGRYADAEPLYRLSLAAYEKALGRYHPHVATTLNNLARLYQSQGRYADAESSAANCVTASAIG
jgi:tetratricopeptide (TPR) repeat protein